MPRTVLRPRMLAFATLTAIFALVGNTALAQSSKWNTQTTQDALKPVKWVIHKSGSQKVPKGLDANGQKSKALNEVVFRPRKTVE